VALGVADERLGHAIHLIVRAAHDVEDAEAKLPRALAKELPNFMQPHVIHWKETMPLNPNGKLDRTALKREIGA
jgi:acyl-coenzyme A synthetase/AMP-(fatty) acid ligase